MSKELPRPTADAPTAEQIVAALHNAVDAQTPSKTWMFKPEDAEVLSWLASHLPSLIAADADRQPWTTEVVAEAIYDAMRENDPEGKDKPWVFRGNSLKQDEARQRARAVFRAARSPEGEPNG